MGIFGPGWSDYYAQEAQIESLNRMVQSLGPKIDQLITKVDASNKAITQVQAQNVVLSANTEQILANQDSLVRELVVALEPLQGLSELKALNANCESLITVLEGLAKSVKKLTRPPDPGRLSLSIVEELMSSVMKYDVVLPVAADAAEVQGGELTVTLAGSDPVVVSTAAGQAKVEGLEGPQDAAVSLSFVFIDDAGNKSTTPSVLDATLRDTIPPEDPGALGIEITGETTV